MPKIQWSILRPIQWKKHGCWYSHVKHPETQEIVMERIDMTGQQCINACIEWAVYKNKMIEEEEAITNAKPIEMESTLAEDCSGNKPAI